MKLSDMSGSELLRGLTIAIRRPGQIAEVEVDKFVREARHRLAQEALTQRHRKWVEHRIRRCCPRSARCSGPFPEVRRYLRALAGPGFPEDGLISHFGESFRHGRVRVSIAAHGESHLFLGFYPDSGAFSEDLMRSWLKQAGKIARVVKTWKGSSGGNLGISIVLARPCPEGLLTALNNYRALGSEVFQHEKYKSRYDKFDAWLERRLEGVRA